MAAHSYRGTCVHSFCKQIPFPDPSGTDGNSHDFHRALSVARHVFRNAAEQETLPTPAPVGTHNDEIRTPLRGSIDELLSVVTVFDCAVRLETRSAKPLSISLYQPATVL